MSIYSDSLPDDEYNFLANRENRKERKERDTYGERIFNGDCPYTGKHCMDWTCQSCEVNEAESHLFEDEDSEGGLISED